MTIAAKISSGELSDLVTDRYTDQYFEVRLIDAEGVSYIPGVTVDATYLAQENTPGLNSYERQVFKYTSGDVSVYSDDGIALSTKATVFDSSGQSDFSYSFTAAALVWGEGNVITLDTPSVIPDDTCADGSYTSIKPDSTDGSGSGLEVDIVVTNSGATAGDFAITVSKFGSNYQVGDIITILPGTLNGLGMTSSATTGLTFAVDTISSSSNAGQIVSVAEVPQRITLVLNQAVFYWNLKQFGYYSV